MHNLAPIGLSDHTLMNVPILMAPAPSKCKYWYFNKVNWNNLRDFFSDFLWVHYCLLSGDASVSATHSHSKFPLVRLEAFIPSSSNLISSSKAWFNCSCSETIQARNQAYRVWKTLLPPTHVDLLMLYVITASTLSIRQSIPLFK